MEEEEDFLWGEEAVEAAEAAAARILEAAQAEAAAMLETARVECAELLRERECWQAEKQEWEVRESASKKSTVHFRSRVGHFMYLCSFLCLISIDHLCMT